MVEANDYQTLVLYTPKHGRDDRKTDMAIGEHSPLATVLLGENGLSSLSLVLPVRNKMSSARHLRRGAEAFFLACAPNVCTMVDRQQLQESERQ